MKMKTILLALITLVFLSGTVSATDVTISDTDLATMAKLYGSGTLTAVIDVPGAGVQYDFTGITWDGTMVGDDFPISGTICGGEFGGDCSAHSAYAACVTNLGDVEVHVNLDMNTGWTDDPWNHADTFAQNGWTYFGPGETKTITLSFSGADLYPTPGLNPVPLTNEVSKIGFQVGSNVAGAKSIVVAGGACPPDSPPTTTPGGGTEEIPEFPTAAIPAVVALGGYLLIRRRKQD